MRQYYRTVKRRAYIDCHAADASDYYGRTYNCVEHQLLKDPKFFFIFKILIEIHTQKPDQGLKKHSSIFSHASIQYILQLQRLYPVSENASDFSRYRENFIFLECKCQIRDYQIIANCNILSFNRAFLTTAFFSTIKCARFLLN